MFSFPFFIMLFSLHTFSNKVGIYMWVFIQYLPFYIYGNLNNLGNVHILSLFPLSFYEMPLLSFCAETAYFLMYFSNSVHSHTFTVLYKFYPFSVAFSYCGLLFAHLWTICITVHPFYNTNTSHICHIFYNRHIYNITSIILVT